MENENVIAVKKYILSLNIENKTKIVILNEFNEFIKSLKNFYDKILQNNSETAEMYIKINCEKFKNNLDTYVFSNNNPTKHIKYIKKHISKENERKIRNDKLEAIYTLIKTDNLNNTFYKRILTCSTVNYDTLCADIRNLAYFLGYSDLIDNNENYTDLDIQTTIDKHQ